MFLKSKYFSVIVLIFLYGCNRPTENINENEVLSPSSPSNLHLFFVGDGRISFNWDRNMESNIEGYNIFRSINDTLNFTKISFTANPYYIDDSLEYNNLYFYRITAVDNNGKESTFSSIISGKPINLSPPLIPSGLEINARNWIGVKSVYLKWTPNDEGDIQFYKIYRGTNKNFTADSSTYVGKTGFSFFSDTSGLKFSKEYFYKITAVDKGGLSSIASSEVSDLICEIPEVLFPKDSTRTGGFNQFVIKSIGIPASYKIILQDNPYFGEIWSSEFSSSKIYDTIRVNFDYYYLYRNTTYYWRIVTFSGSNEPNSISQLYNFTIRPNIE